MSQLSLAFDASLMIRDEQGRYLPATAEQILDAARKVSRLAVGDPNAPVMLNIHRTPSQQLQYSREIGRAHV